MDPTFALILLSVIFANNIFAFPGNENAGIRRPMPGSIGNMPLSSRQEASSFRPVSTELPQADCDAPMTPFMVFGHPCSAPTDCDIDGARKRIHDAAMRISTIDRSPERMRLPGTELGFNRTVLDCAMRHEEARLEIMQKGGLAWCARDTWVAEHPECSDKALDAYIPGPVMMKGDSVMVRKASDGRAVDAESRVDPSTFHGVDPDVAAGNAFALQEERKEKHIVEARPYIKTATKTREVLPCGNEAPAYLFPDDTGLGPTAWRTTSTRTETSRTHDGRSTLSASRLHVHMLEKHTFTTLPSPTRPAHTGSHILQPRQDLRDFEGSVTPSGYTVVPITYKGKEYTTFCQICKLRYGDRISRGASEGGQLLFAEDNGYPWPEEEECKDGCQRSCNVLGICTGGPFHPFPTDPALREKQGLPPL